MEASHERLRFPVPQTFEDRSVVTFMEPDVGGFRHSVVVTMEPVNPHRIDLDGYVARQTAELRAQLKGCIASRPVPRKTSGDLPFLEVRLRWLPEGRPPVRQVMAFFIVDRQAYTLTMSAQEEAFERWREEVFEPILQRLRIAPPPGPTA